MLEIINQREIERILTTIHNQFEVDSSTIKNFKSYLFFKNSKNKIYLLSNFNNLANDLLKLRIENHGLYIGTLKNDGFRLSIEGSFLFGRYAKKNIVEIDEKQLNEWMKGYDLSLKSENQIMLYNTTNNKSYFVSYSKDLTSINHRYLLLKFNGFFIGCGRLIDGVIKCTVPKERRLLSKEFII